MTDVLKDSRVLFEDPQVKQLHEDGLSAELLTGDYPLAHEAFKLAQDVLSRSPMTVDSVVQSARITRDDGVTYLRNAISERNPNILNKAYEVLSRSVDQTTPLMSGKETLPILGLKPHVTPRQARREVLAEHGATVSLLGRLATVKAVMHGIDTRGDSERAVLSRSVDQQQYGAAHDMLRRGNNGYYRVSNAMVGARQERLNSQFQNMSVWLGRAAVGLVWTAAFDEKNLKRAAQTSGSRLRDLRSYKAAVKSVTAHP